jgi:hypothetical protein
MADDFAAVPQAGSVAAPGSSVLDRILLAVDGSPASDFAVRSVATLIRSHKGKVFVVHVSADGPLVSSFFSPDAMTLRWGTTSEAQAHVDDAVRTLVSLGVRATGRVYTRWRASDAKLSTRPARSSVGSSPWAAAIAADWVRPFSGASPASSFTMPRGQCSLRQVLVSTHRRLVGSW